MNNKKTYITIVFAILLILILGFSYWYLSPRPITENTASTTPKVTQMTDQQKLDILSALSNTKGQVLSDAEKKKILNQVSTSTKQTVTLSDAEKLQILNSTK